MLLKEQDIRRLRVSVGFAKSTQATCVVTRIQLRSDTGKAGDPEPTESVHGIHQSHSKPVGIALNRLSGSAIGVPGPVERLGPLLGGPALHPIRLKPRDFGRLRDILSGTLVDNRVKSEARAANLLVEARH